MNIIITNFHNKEFLPIVNQVFKKFDIKIGHITFNKKKPLIKRGIKKYFYDLEVLENANYAVDWAKVTPLDEDLIEKMAPFETLVLRMMDRLPYDLSYEERKYLYLRHLQYWNHVIKRDRINLYITSAPPHEVYDYIIYCLCKLSDIPTILLSQLHILDTVSIMNDLELNDLSIKSKYQKLLKKYKHTKISEIELTGRLKEDFELHTGTQKVTPFYMLWERPHHNIIISFFSLLKNLTIQRYIFLLQNPDLLFRSAVTYISRIILYSKQFNFRKKNFVTPNLAKKYIYFPLHFQPEATTSPMGGVFVDQILVAQMIAYYLPKNVYIYVKENPYQTSVGRSLKFYEDLLKIPQVRLVPDDFDTHDLTENSIAVATVAGTVGLEALYKAKPVLMFGHNFYQFANGVFQIRSNTDCSFALKKILQDGYKPSLKDFKIFLKALEDTTIESYIDPYYIRHGDLTIAKSNENIFQRLTKEVHFK